MTHEASGEPRSLRRSEPWRRPCAARRSRLASLWSWARSASWSRWCGSRVTTTAWRERRRRSRRPARRSCLPRQPRPAPFAGPHRGAARRRRPVPARRPRRRPDRAGAGTARASATSGRTTGCCSCSTAGQRRRSRCRRCRCRSRSASTPPTARRCHRRHMKPCPRAEADCPDYRSSGAVHVRARDAHGRVARRAHFRGVTDTPRR